MSDTGFAFWWREHRRDRPPSSGRWKTTGKDDFQGHEEKTTGRHPFPDPVPDWSEDLFRVARAVFLADKLAPRAATLDHWTRRIRLSVPVSDPDRWSDTPAAHHLSVLLQTLTSDVWSVEFRELRPGPAQETLPADAAWNDHLRAGEIALFSGGLDSLSWAAQRAVVRTSEPLLLVTFREVRLNAYQDHLYEAVKNLARPTGSPATRPVHRLTIRQFPSGGALRKGRRRRLETSSRSRGLLYTAGAVRAAAAHGTEVVRVPENGQLAINPPLSPARVAACSTRSVHPWTLHHLNGLIRAVAAVGGVNVENPLQPLTKGEVCARGVAAGLTPADLSASVSCGKPPLRRRDGQDIANCGVCFPCLVRRSGLLHATGTDTTAYETDLRGLDLNAERAEDWRAVIRWLRTPYGFPDLISDLPLPPGTAPSDVLPVIRRGREELAALERSVRTPETGRTPRPAEGPP